MKIAILGLPQTGKRTLFSLLTGREAPEFRKAGEVIEGIAPVVDPRVDKLDEIEKPEKKVYANTEFLLCSDISPGSRDYSWLQEARNSELVCMVVREFSSEDVYHEDGSVDAARDRENLKAELLLADLDLVEKRIERIEKDLKRVKPTQAQLTEQKTVIRCREVLEDSKLLNTMEFAADEFASIKSLNFITLKPILWCFNVDEDKIEQKSSEEKNSFRVSALIEKEISSIDDDDEKKEYMQELGFSDSGINRLTATVYDLMGLMSFYTTGKDEVRAWTIPKGTLAAAAGGKIHSDIERGFIRVEIMKYDDLISLGSEQAVKAQGKALKKGKDYTIEDGDICHFLFNV